MPVQRCKNLLSSDACFIIFFTFGKIVVIGLMVYKTMRVILSLHSLQLRYTISKKFKNIFINRIDVSFSTSLCGVVGYRAGLIKCDPAQPGIS
jgi:hypothetical protein